MPSRPKIFRDPVHGFIGLDTRTELPIVDTKEFQRLRRIRQLGVTFLTYHGGDRSRFAHSFGVFHLFCKVIDRLKSIKVLPDSEDVEAGRFAALFHDVGHGPFSHVMEGKLVGNSHETWTNTVIISPESGINQILTKIDATLPERVACIIRGGSTSVLCQHIIASQFDVDRMDYLLRDAMATGNSIGRFDLDRILATLDLDHSQLVFSDQYLAEQFIFARYFAYWQIYFHKTTRGFERLLDSIWRRAKSLHAQCALDDASLAFIGPFLDGKATPAQYLAIDDQDIMQAVKVWTESDDPVLKDLSERFLYRKPFKCLETTDRPDISEIAKEVVSKRGYKETDYYVLIDMPSSVPYDYYTRFEDEEKPPILALDRSLGRYREISKISDAVRAVACKRVVIHRIYVPDDACREDLKQRLK